jgi:glycosyltransferase involved in cell wall biosynthesis
VTPRVTVLLAVYDGGACLREGVESVLGQTFEDFELLIVDDASTDDAVASLPPDPRIRVLRNERNIGQIPSMNRGLREARGDYVARLDHDDVCLPLRLERQVALLDSLPEVALTATWVDIVDMQGRLWTHVRPRVDSFSDFVCHVVTGHVHLVHPSLMFRRELVLRMGGFDERLNAAEDQDLYRRLVLGRHEARVVPETLLRYRRHEQQMTVAKSASVWESDARSYDRFLAALAPGAPASTVRFMLRNDPRFWAEPDLPADWLERFLDEAAATLRLAAPERSALSRGLSRSAIAAMLSGWAGDGDPAAYPRRGRELAVFAARHGEARSRALASVAPVLAATANAGVHVGAGRARLTHALRSDTFAAPRRIARGSRFLRRMYARVIDTRTRDY